MRIDALDAFYRSEKSCDNGHTALGDAYPFMLAEYSSAEPAMMIIVMCSVQYHDRVEEEWTNDDTKARNSSVTASPDCILEHFQHDDDEKEGHDGNDNDDDEEEGQVGWVTSLIGISAKVRNLKLLLGDNLPP